MNRDDLLAVQTHDNIVGFLRVLRQGETSQDDDTAYRMMFGGELFEAPPWVHPNKAITKRGITSTAAGAYQFLYRTWNDIAPIWGLDDFSPANQDLGAVALLHRCRAIEPLLKGDLDEAIRRANRTWASLPGSPYGQGGISLKTCKEVFASFGGRENGAAAVSRNDDPLASQREVKPMGPAILFPLLQLAAQYIPQIAEKFGSGSEVSNRNLAAGKVIADAIVDAVKPGSNLQTAIEEMQANPEAIKAANVAVAEVWPSVFEAGGGGIDGARKYAQEAGGAEWWRLFVNPQFWLSLLLLGLVYMAMGNVTGLFGFQEWTPENRSNVLFLIVGTAIGAVTGFWFGTSHSSAKKDAALIAR